MAHPVIMPRQGQSVETCILTRWYKQKGEKVAEGDFLFAFETDKAAFDEEAQVSGILLDIFYEEGDEVPVLANVAVIGEQGEPVDEFRPAERGKESPEEVESASGEKPEELMIKEEPAVSTVAYRATSGEIPISPRAKKLAEQKSIGYTNLAGTGPGGRIIERDILQAIRQSPVVTPLAREKLKSGKLGMPQQKAHPGIRITSGDLIEKPEEGTVYTDRPLSRMRKLIAAGMQRSLSESAQLTHHISAGAGRILALRQKVKTLETGGRLPDITLNDMVCYAVIRTLEKHPEMNGHFLGETIRVFRSVHLGFAVDTERGLMVPVVKDASRLTLPELSMTMKELAQACQSGSINPDLLAAGEASFTVTNLGSFGIEYFTPVLNLPQIGILGVNTIRYQPKPLENGGMGFFPHIGYSLTYDHRAIDGAPASRFLKDLCAETENIHPGIPELE
ncbi:MAG: 2-oxo acid dehydrogenase subunit E2 [Chlorobi bacterium]|nr:2-oxo acid dehydrogenase subunit E2 [Chlorobiota bacterium]